MELQQKAKRVNTTEHKSRQITKRLVRLLKFVRLLSQRHYSRRELAQKLCVSQRTVSRDLAVLKEAELTVMYEHPDGHIIVDKSWATPIQDDY